MSLSYWTGSPMNSTTSSANLSLVIALSITASVLTESLSSLSLVTDWLTKWVDSITFGAIWLPSIWLSAILSLVTAPFNMFWELTQFTSRCLFLIAASFIFAP